MATQLESYQDAARLAGWTAAWQEMLRFVLPIIQTAGRYEDTRNAVLMRDLCTSQLFMSGASGGLPPGKLSPEISTLPKGENMTISFSLSAHASGDDSDAQKAAEDKMLLALRNATAKVLANGELYSATASTQHHGTVDLAAAVRETEPAPE